MQQTPPSKDLADLHVPLTSTDSQNNAQASMTTHQVAIDVDTSDDDTDDDNTNDTKTEEAERLNRNNGADDDDNDENDEEESSTVHQGASGAVFVPKLNQVLDASNCGAQGRIDESGQSITYTNEGYCLLFYQKTKYHQVTIDGDKLVASVREELNDEEIETALKIKLNRKKNLLGHFKTAGLQYTIKESRDEYKTWIYVFVTVSHEVAEQFADHKNLAVRIDPVKAIEIGRKSKDFLLAHRTWLGTDNDPKTFRDEKVRHKEFDKLPLTDWEFIHVPFESSINKQVYKRYYPHNNLLDNRSFLRVLYELLTEDHAVMFCDFLCYFFILFCFLFFLTHNNPHGPLANLV